MTGQTREGVLEAAPARPYSGPVPTDELQALTAELMSRPWLDAVYDRYYHQRPTLFRLIAEETRADFRFLLPLAPGARVLEVGPDWGVVTAAFARSHPVTLLDTGRERLDFIRARLTQEGLMASYVVADPAAWPLDAGSVDAVILNGSLARLSEGLAPLKLLQEALRVLTPDGLLYLGAENPRAFRALLAESEAVPVLDYQALLVEAGFQVTSVAWPYPDGPLPEALLSAGPQGALAYYLKAVREPRPPSDPAERLRRLELGAVEVGTQDGFAPAYGLVARKVAAC